MQAVRCCRGCRRASCWELSSAAAAAAIVSRHQLLTLAGVVTVATEGGSVSRAAPMGCRREVSD